MWETIQIILLLLALVIYIVTAYFIILLVKKRTVDTNKYFRLVVLSFVYSLFWGLGIAGSNGNPGFAIPAPNIVAIGLMLSSGFYKALLRGLVILSFWWTIIFVSMLIRQIYKNRKSKSLQPLQ